jgi:UDP-glucose 4-epimerase
LSIYIITGGAGFIGSHLAETLLDAGHSVRVLDNLSTGRRENIDPRCQFIQGDVTDRATLDAAMQGTDGCFHLAAIASVERANQEWVATHRVNQTGAVMVFDVARAICTAKGGLPVVYASSAAVYGDIGAEPAHEQLRPVPNTAYGADKLGCELHARVAHLVHGVPNLGLRFFNVYGPRQDPLSPYSGVISIFARMLADGASLTIHGDGGQTRDFVYVSDVVAHLVAGMAHVERKRGCDVLNVCTGSAISVLDLARAMMAAQGGRSEGTRSGGRANLITHGPSRAGDIRHSVGDPAAATGLLGVAAGVTLSQGLAQTVAALSGNRAGPAPRAVVA